MLWNKTVYRIKLNGGHGMVVTKPVRDLIQHLIVRPFSMDTIWSMVILDKANDPLYEVVDHQGRLDEFRGIPVGMDQSEPLNIQIYDTTANEQFDIIFKVKEVR